MQTINSIHPEVQRGLNAIEHPDVQEMIEKLSAYGLAVALPHMHAEDGRFLPLPEDSVGFESDLKVTFPNRNDPILTNAIPVMWRWDGNVKAVGNCALCDFYKHP